MSTKKPIRVKKWIRSGELNPRNRTQASILYECGGLLDSACSHEILGGDVLFEGTDGKHYVITVEAVIGRANPEYVKDILLEDKE
jgi:hypothetical protein